jgi:uncharacterized membrane protein HdeD (DUF308 family)
MNTTVKLKSPNFWVALLKGVLLIVFGLWLFNSPNENLIKLSFIFGLIIVIGGVGEIALAFKNRNYNEYWTRGLTSGIIDLLLGAFLMANPTFILLLITILVSVWLVFRGIVSIRFALILKDQHNENWVWGFIFGIILIAIGAVFVWHPAVFGITLGVWAALAFISLGVFRILFVFNLLGNKKKV